MQTLGILADNNVSTAEFSEAVKGCIPEASDEIIAEENRRDLTDLHAFTIDPAGSNGIVSSMKRYVGENLVLMNDVSF